MVSSIAHYQQALDQLQSKQQYRRIPALTHHGKFVEVDNKKLLNIASNDYLALGMDSKLQADFLDYIADMPMDERPKLGATSSRLLTGNDTQLSLLENELEAWYASTESKELKHASLQKSALVFNSGYHANIGLLPALTRLPVKTVIIADKLVHASIIDGLQLSKVNNKTDFKRYRHNDYAHLQSLIKCVADDIQRIIIVTESIFSMDGDKADLKELVKIKQTDKRIELYVDEAHAVGVCGKTGCGVAEETNTIGDIDYLVGTFGKSFASMGAYLICEPVVKQWLTNSLRPLIFSTALPPMTHAWSRFVLAKMPYLNDKRKQLHTLSSMTAKAIEEKTQQANPSQSAIIPYILGSNALALDKAQQLQQAGFYALPIRPPTVPANTARVRLVMHAAINQQQHKKLLQCL